MAERVVLVTGADGFVGRHTVAHLAASGWQVRAAARTHARIAAAPGIEPVPFADLAGPVDWPGLLAGASHVVHLAGIAHRTGRIPDEVYHRVNAVASGEMAAAAAQAGLERVVFISSVRAQAGPASENILREDDSPQPGDAYGRSKLAGERLVLEAGVPAVVLRPVAVYGPGTRLNMAALARLARLPVPLPLGALHARRSVLSVGNLAEAIAFALAAPGLDRETFLVADPEPVSVRDMVVAMRKGLGRRPWLVPVPQGALATGARLLGRGDLVDRLVRGQEVDVAKLLAAGWRPRETTAEALGAMMRAP